MHVSSANAWLGWGKEEEVRLRLEGAMLNFAPLWKIKRVSHLGVIVPLAVTIFFLVGASGKNDSDKQEDARYK
jgi:hypothetical protein